jgi:uncharacterized ferredoxin-like protein
VINVSPSIDNKRAERDAVLEAVMSLIVYGGEKDIIAEKMEEIAAERGLEGFRRDAKSVRDSGAVILVGVRGNKSIGLNCGACGFEECKAFDKTKKKSGKDFVGPQCVFKCLNLGIALGSAVKVASLLNVDNRIMYPIGTAAMKIKMLSEATTIIGIPVSATGKNIYFERGR